MTMTSDTPSARKPASSRSLTGALTPKLLAGALLLFGCARDPIDEAAWQASRVGTAFGDHPEKTQVTGIEAGSRIAERYYFVAKYEATLEQRRLAEAAGRKAEARVRAHSTRPVQPPHSGRIGKLQPKLARYLAVRTRSDARAKTPVSVMIWDTQTEEIVGNNVYDINSPPPTGASVKFETFSAEYVGAGN
jgi:hypothetical protein